MIEEAGVRFNNGDYYHLKVDTEQTTCEVDGTIDGVPVTFFGDVEAGRLIGGTVAWNQLAKNSNSNTYTKYGLTVTKVQGESKVAILGESDYTSGDKNLYVGIDTATFINGHKYLCFTNSEIFTLYNYGAGSASTTKLAYIMEATTTATANFTLLPISETAIASGTTINETVSYACIDLTQMFGSTIADYIYSLEQDTPGAGVDLFKTLFAPDDYYPYDAGTQMKIALIPEA